MKITLVTDAWHPQVNGVVRALATTCARLQGRGHEVEVIGPHRFRTVPMPTYPEIRLALCTRSGIGRALASSQPDAVHIATEGPLGWGARNWLVRRGIGFTTSFHTMFPVYLRMRTGIPESWSFSVLRRFHSAAAATMVSTPTLEGLLTGYGFENLVRWVRGVDTETFRPLAGVKLDGPRPHLMYVGRIAVEKNVEAFMRLRVPGTKFVVGDGPLRGAMEAKYPEVRFLGTRHGEDLVRIYSAADAFVFPSLTDTLGLVMLEALACGVPVAAYPVQGPLDVIGGSAAGVLHSDLEAAVDGALAVDRAACRGHALNFSWDRSVEQFQRNLVEIETSRRQWG